MENVDTENENLCNKITPTLPHRSVIDRVFGGTKKAWILIMTIGILGLYYTRGEVPAGLLLLYTTIISIYFGAGSVKLGMDITKK